MKPTLQESLKALQENLVTKQENLAEHGQALSNAKTELAALRKAKSADAKARSELTLQCQAYDASFESRSKSRKEEVEVIDKAIKVLEKGPEEEEASASSLLMLGRR